jgi:hypothetical protein
MARGLDYRWIPTNVNPPGWYGWFVFAAAAAGFVAASLVFLDPPWLARDILLFVPVGGDTTPSFEVYSIGVGVPVLFVLNALRLAVRRVGLADAGICVETRLSAKDIPWDRLQGDADPRWPKREWCQIGYARGKWNGPWSFWATRDQARAILTHPKAPAKAFPARYWTWLGLPVPVDVASESGKPRH